MKQPLIALTPTRINLPAVSMDGSAVIVGRHGVCRRCRMRQIAAGASHTGIVTDTGDLIIPCDNQRQHGQASINDSV